MDSFLCMSSGDSFSGWGLKVTDETVLLTADLT